MDVSSDSVEQRCEGQTDRYPLLMEQPVNGNGREHVIDISRSSLASTSVPNEEEPYRPDNFHYEDRPSTSMQAPVSQLTSQSPIVANPQDPSFARRGDNYGRRHRSPLNSGLWISVELVVNLSQIIAAIIVLVLSRQEHPQAPLFTWIVGYTAGCFAAIPHLFWRYLHRNSQVSGQEAAHLRQSSQNNTPESNSYTAITITQAPGGENLQTHSSFSWFRRRLLTASPRFHAIVDHFKMALDCFFAIWFVVGNVWIFGGHSSAADAPNLYRLCIVFLTFSCIGYAMPFILCATICCCLPCIISILGFREDLNQTRGATAESINSLPTHKFKSKKGSRGAESAMNSEGLGEGGILAAGTDKERIISAEDAVCCICLAKYEDDDELRELPCTHLFHTECVDKWLKINALCPLCKSVVGDSTTTPSSTNARRVGSNVDHQETQ